MTPPTVFDWLLRRALPPGPAGEAIRGDLIEELSSSPDPRLGRRRFRTHVISIAIGYAGRRLRVAADGWLSVPATRERGRATDHHGETAMGSLKADVRYTVRALVKAPVFTAVTVVTLALGIGANSAIFSLVNAVLLRPTGYVDADRLMLLYEGFRGSPFEKIGVSPPDFVDLAALQRSFSSIGAYRTQLYELSGAGAPEQITGVRVSASVFPILGVPAAHGRTFLESEDQPGQDVAVIGFGLWQRRYGGDPNAVGRTVTLDRRPYTIVGIMPASFQFPKRGPRVNGEPAQVWTPLALGPFERSQQARGMMYNHTVVGRLRGGVAAEQAVGEAGALGPALARNYPANLQGGMDSLMVSAVPLTADIAGQVQRPLLILLGAVGLVLLVACANVANLVLSRAVTRQREISVRAALGAGRRRLLQMLLVEGLLLTAAGGALGLFIGHAAVRAVPEALTLGLPGVQDVGLDVRVVLFTFALSALTAVVFGLLPLVVSERRDLTDLLREGGARSVGGARRHRIQAMLVVSSVALAVVLLAGAGLLMRSFTKLMAVETGIRAPRVLTMQVRLPRAGYDSVPAVRSFYQGLHDRVRAIPSVRAASIQTDLPLKGDGERRSFTADQAIDPGAATGTVAVTWTFGDYFLTFGVPVVKGRAFLPEEDLENRRTAIVSRALAERCWPGQDPIGKRLKWGTAASQAPWQTVVGVVGDVVDGKLNEPPIVHIYVPFAEAVDPALGVPMAGLVRRMTVAAVTDRDVAALVDPMRAAIAALDPALAVAEVTTMAQVLADESAPQRFSTVLLGAFASGAVLLAAVGLYGMLAFGVALRTREIGVRLALGATRGEVLGLVVREGMTLTMAGLGLGIAGAFAATRLMRGLLYQTAPLDPVTFASVPGILAVVALLACYLPARRAARVEPMAALRAE
jgi:putative ABC transport system permease protein